MAFSIKDQVAIVTGASSGIGVAIAEQLAAAGAKVVLAARRIDRLQDVKAKVESSGGKCVCVKCDVTKLEEVTELVKQAEATFGPVDILVNNAGVAFYTLMKNALQDQWNEMVDVNIKGTLNCTGAVLPSMVQRGKGHIVTVSSDAGRMPFAGLAVYTGTKYFIEGWSQTMRIELANSGVKVTTVQPGSVPTEILDRSTDAEAAKFNTYFDAEILKASDVAGAVLYAIQQPPYCAVNEVLIQPITQPR